MNKKLLTCIMALMLASSSVPAYANSTTSSIGIGVNNMGVVTKSGQLVMWGLNEEGEFGIGTVEIHGPMGFTNSVKDVVSVACGYYNSTAILKKDGTMWVCGKNDCYQLGNRTNVSSANFIKLDSNVVKIGAGSGYFTYLKKDGTLWGLGNPGENRLVEIGDGMYVKQPKKLMSGVRDFSTWSRNTGVITKNDELYMFGTNINGQLGIGNNKEGAKLPVKVMDNVRSVSCGSDYVLAVKKDNTLYSWGKNDYGQLMNRKTSYEDDYVPVYAPTKVADNVLKACAGSEESLYITTNNELYFAGHNLDGQLGTDTNGDSVVVPIKLAENVRDAAIGENTVYVALDGKMYTAGFAVNGTEHRNEILEQSYKIRENFDYSNLLKYEKSPKEQPDVGNINNKKTVKVKKIKIIGKKKMKVKGKQKLKVKVLPLKATNKKVTWKSSNKKIATVNKKGLVVAKKKGTVVITAKAKDKSNKKGKIKIKIK